LLEEGFLQSKSYLLIIFCPQFEILGILREQLVPTPQRITLNYFEYSTVDFSWLWIRAFARINSSVLFKKQANKSRNIDYWKGKIVLYLFWQLLCSRDLT